MLDVTAGGNRWCGRAAEILGGVAGPKNSRHYVAGSLLRVHTFLQFQCPAADRTFRDTVDSTSQLNLHLLIAFICAQTTPVTCPQVLDPHRPLRIPRLSFSHPGLGARRNTQHTLGAVQNSTTLTSTSVSLQVKSTSLALRETLRL